jgi:hypothetical protein
LIVEFQTAIFPTISLVGFLRVWNTTDTQLAELQKIILTFLSCIHRHLSLVVHLTDTVNGPYISISSQQRRR